MSEPRPSPPGKQVHPSEVPMQPNPAPTVIRESAELAADRERLQREEEQRIDRERQEELARQRELARFD